MVTMPISTCFLPEFVRGNTMSTSFSLPPCSEMDNNRKHNKAVRNRASHLRPPLGHGTSSFPKSTFCESVAFSIVHNPSRAEKWVRLLPNFARNTSRVVCHHNPYSQAKKLNRVKE